ncbi:nucleotidyltransferase family protein [Alicyclobacillus sp. ALC3]|uniref:nucleotidyltransferase family protein n=1 Tax=Alicyclobacillus sp. ALC3 TaxID=2796143 RepID=UPI002378DB3A|nr:nucleotidyltransferase family protein [Alicyclobacillus sp. ALC3]WDL97146.1 nucleotidyltransferase family protein [Alicyclobacillus sp. ALC3]
MTHQRTASSALIVLAAGFGRRMREQKLLLADRQGVPVIRRTVMTACRAADAFERSQVVLICNPEFPDVATVCSDLPVRVQWNPRAEEGMSTSLSVGIRWADERNFDSAVVILGDQPELHPDIPVELVRAHMNGPNTLLVQARYQGVPGHPILFSRSLYIELCAVFGDEGGRSVVRAHRDQCKYVDFSTEPLPDLDTPEDYSAFLRRDS